jgi:hypothetical protein
MANLTKNDTPELLRQISAMGSYGRAESEPDQNFLQRYLPLPEHARALDPEVILVIGDRGAGKTELFRAIHFSDGLDAIQKLGTRKNLPDPAKSKWLVGYSSSGTEYPPELVFRQFSKGKQPADLQFIWLGLLLRCLHRAKVLPENMIPKPMRDTLVAKPLVLEELFSATQEHIEACFGALDETDASLAQASEWVFVSYDELDRVSAGDWNELRTILRGLVQFWSSYARRWKRVRPKIFLRRDLFNRIAFFGPDVSKIAAQRVELVWTTRDLYALSAKRLLNHTPLLQQYFEPAKLAGEIRGELGWYPTATREEDYRRFIERICGKYMGAEPKKGRSFTWIPNHLQDGYGRVLPRSMVRFFESAAEIELKNQRAAWPRLLHHSSLRGAIDEVSVSRVQEIEDEEFPWMKTVRSQISTTHPQVPIDRREFERLLTIDWDGATERPPESSGHGLLQLLMELGVFYLRGDGRVDARDLYLRGFGLKRKGGVARPY